MSKSQDFRSERPLELDEVKLLISSLIRQTHEKLVCGRIKDEKKEEVRIKALNSLIQLAKTYSKLLETQKIQDLEKEIELLKKNYMAK